MKIRRSLVALVLVTSAMSGCSLPSGETTVQVSVGYQSRTLNTATAGTLLRDLGYFEAALDELGRENGKRYKVTWNDFSSGAPITAKMLADQVDIGSMGDFPLLINAFRTHDRADSRTRLIAVTAYSRSGALNGIVVPVESDATTLPDDGALNVSTSLGSAGHGLLLRAAEAGLIGGEMNVSNQDPAVGAASVRSGKVDALAQFAPWPALLAFQGDARLLLDGGVVGAPTFHGVVARSEYIEQHPEVIEAFLSSVAEATRYIQGNHLPAAQRVAKSTGLPLDVVYLYLGPYGLATFATGLESFLISDLNSSQYYLRSVIPNLEVDVGQFVDSTPIEVSNAVVPSEFHGRLKVVPCEVMYRDGSIETFATLASLISSLNKRDAWHKVSSFYVSDEQTGTRWFGKDAIFIRDPNRESGDLLVAFATAFTASKYLNAHKDASVVSLRHLQEVP